MKLSEEQAAVGLWVIGLGVYSLLSKKNQNQKHLHYDLGPRSKVNGIAQTVRVGPGDANRFRQYPSDITFISTAELFDSETGQTAELLFAYRSS